MPDTLIKIKGILKTGAVVEKTFVTRHNTIDELKVCIDGFLKDATDAGGIMFVKDQRQPRSVNNSIFFFKEAFDHLEFEAKTITGAYDQEGTKQ